MLLAQLKNELWKLFGKKRTYIGFGAFILAQTAMLLAFKFTRWQSDMAQMLSGNGYLATEFISALTVSVVMLMPQIILLLPLYVALVGGDLVAKEAEDGTLRMILSRPISRVRLLGVKWLDAEEIRDVALQASGLLDPKIGGPSAMPYQPEGVWNSPYSGERWMERDKYRRGVYTFWKRTATYPVYSAFDAGSREECVPRRARTNTPLQALAMLNDPSMMEAARALGLIMAKQGIEAGFLRVTARMPNPVEKQRLLDLRNKLEKQYKADPAAAKKVGGDAAWTMVANVLLNMDEAITKE